MPHNGSQGPDTHETGGHHPPVSPFRAGLTLRCPRCGKGRLFRGFLDLQEHCARCGLAFRDIVSGDGPAVFIILIVGALVTFSALAVETTFAPPYWVHVVLWGPLSVFGALGFLRPFKALWIALHYSNGVRTEQAASEDADDDG